MKFQFLSILVIVTALSTMQVNAENLNQEKSQVCKSVDACEKLAKVLQGQLDDFEKVGLENLSGDEFVRYAELSEKHLLILDLLIVEQKKVTAEQRKVLVEQRKITAEQRKVIAEMLQAQDKKIKELRDILSE